MIGGLRRAERGRHTDLSGEKENVPAPFSYLRGPVIYRMFFLARDPEK